MQCSAAVYTGLWRGAARSADLLLWQAVAMRDFLSAALTWAKKILDTSIMHKYLLVKKGASLNVDKSTLF